MNVGIFFLGVGCAYAAEFIVGLVSRSLRHKKREKRLAQEHEANKRRIFQEANKPIYTPLKADSNFWTNVRKDVEVHD